MNTFAIVLIILCIFVLMWTIRDRFNCALVENMGNTIINTDSRFYSLIDANKNKLVNLSCKLSDQPDGETYYLATIANGLCSIGPSPTECTNATVVLLKQSVLNNNLSTYMEKIKSAPSKRHYLHDFKFNVVASQNPPVRRSYWVSGTSVELINDIGPPTLLNQFLYNERAINKLCGDTYPYGSTDYSFENAEIIIVETTDTGPLAFKLAFVTNNLQKSTHGPPVQLWNGKQKQTKWSYVGVCDTTVNCNLSPRICLYDDLHDSRVLTFNLSFVEDWVYKTAQVPAVPQAVVP